MKYDLKEDDLVRIIQSGGGLGPTLWVVTSVRLGGDVVIREAGNPRSGGQDFHASILKKVPR